MKIIRVGIGDFALPVPRTGSIEVHSGYGPVPNVGQELHALIQKQRQSEFPDYHPEVKISRTIERGRHTFVISGRMDGLIEGDECVIEEIKTAFNASELFVRLKANPEHPYLLQLKTYAYFYWLENGQIPKMVLHVVSSRTGEGRDLELELNLTDYEAWFEKRMDELVDEANKRAKTERRRRQIAQAFKFPFEHPRSGQLELVESIDEGLGEKKTMLIQAPTGLGKTVGVMFPVLREALNRGQKLIYVTPKNSQHSVAEDAVKKFQKQGSKLKALTINAKKKMCLKNETLCNPEYCEYAKDYYKKVYDNRLKDELSRKRNLTPRVFKKVAEQHEVCPFELQLDMVDQVDLVICDYNYVFSPRNSVGRLTHDGTQKKSRPNLVIDEAHNLPHRAMDYFSASITISEFQAMREKAGELRAPFSGELKELIDRAIKIVEGCRPEGLNKSARIEPDRKCFTDLDEEFRQLLNRYLESDVELQPRDVVLQACDRWSGFCGALEFEGDKFFVTYNVNQWGDSIKVTCCDASDWLAQSYGAFSRVVAFSATLKPFDYYAKLSGFKEEKLQIAEFGSPFPKENRKLMVIPQVSTKYSDRAKNYGKIGDAIERIVALKPGNYFVFFPSFEFMQKVSEQVDVLGFNLLKQEREMKTSQVKAYLEQLKQGLEPTVIFAVQGGVFSEGVDYPGDMLIGAIIVGPALPSYNFERELVRGYYEKNYGHGFDYAYIYPAMAKVVQAAGRVIRSASDRGLIVLMDQRFVHDSYTKSMPADWFEESVRHLVPQRVLQEISDFWKGEEVPQ